MRIAVVRSCVVSAGLMLVSAPIALAVTASPQALSTPNASVDVNLQNQAGVTSFDINGEDEASQEWFYYRDSTGPQYNVGSLDLNNYSASDLSGTSGNDYLTAEYGTPAGAAKPFTVDVSYSLVGGPAGSSSADLAETIKITNTGTATLNYTFYAYSDFHLDGASSDSGETTTISGGNTATVTSSKGRSYSQTTINPYPTEYQAASEQTLLNELDNDPNLVLNDTATSPGGEWAFEYDLSIPAGQSAIIALDKYVESSPVPEPMSAMVLTTIGGLCALRRRAR